jgi:AcrR family transcriptional regulator
MQGWWGVPRGTLHKSATMSTTPTTEPASNPRVERTRQAVIDAGMNLLLEQGPDGVNHAAIASAAGVSRTTLYKYWPTRAKLLLEILAAFDAHPQLASSGEVRADLLMLVGELQTSMSDPTRRRVFSSMIAQAQWDDDVSEAQSEVRAIPLGGLAVLLDAAVERGEIIEGVVPIDAAGRLIGPLMFAALVANQDVMTVDLESIIDDWLSTVRP